MDVQDLAERATTELPWHEVAGVFPLLSEEGLEGLVEDIKREGLREPILTVTVDGKELVCDGRNRQMACIQADVPRVYRSLDDHGTHAKADLAARVWSLNYARRHLTPSQLGLAAAEMRKYLAGTIPQVAGMTGASKRNTERADRLLRDGSDALIQSVHDGSVTLHDAEKVVGMPKREQNRRVRLLKDGKIRNVSRAPLPKPAPETEGEGAWLKAVQAPYDRAIDILTEALEIVKDLAADVELSKNLPATRIQVDLEAAKNNLSQNYPAVYHGGPDATRETHPESGGIGFLTRFVWAGLPSDIKLTLAKEDLHDGESGPSNTVQPEE